MDHSIRLKTVAEIEAEIKFIEESVDDNLCCCGDSMDHDPWEAVHSPVSARQYALQGLREDLAAARKAQQ